MSPGDRGARPKAGRNPLSDKGMRTGLNPDAQADPVHPEAELQLASFILNRKCSSPAKDVRRPRFTRKLSRNLDLLDRA